MLHRVGTKCGQEVHNSSTTLIVLLVHTAQFGVQCDLVHSWNCSHCDQLTTLACRAISKTVHILADNACSAPNTFSPPVKRTICTFSRESRAPHNSHRAADKKSLGDTSLGYRTSTPGIPHGTSLVECKKLQGCGKWNQKHTCIYESCQQCKQGQQCKECITRCSLSCHSSLFFWDRNLFADTKFSETDTKPFFWDQIF